ncbi:MAG: DUF6701 domain-containing protein, partial [Pseudomonadota bacterium]
MKLLPGAIAVWMRRFVMVFVMVMTGWSVMLSAVAGNIVVDRVTLNTPSTGGAVFESVTFRQTYASPPLVFVMPTDDSSQPGSLRVRNVTTTGFEFAHVFPDGSIASYPSHTIDYVAVEAGTHSLGGDTLVAGFVDTQRIQSKFGGSSWETVSFGHVYSQTPGVLVQIQTMANEPSADLSTASSPWMTVAMSNVNTSQMRIALDRAETTSGTISQDERIAYLVFDDDANGSFTDAGAATIDFDGERSSDNVTDACRSIGLTGFSAAPIAVASQNTRDGGDGGWLRRCSVSASEIQVRIQEDVATDTDVSHTTERAGALAFSNPFHADASIGFAIEAARANIAAYGGGGLAVTSETFAEAFTVVPRVFTLPTTEETEPASVRVFNITTTGFQIAQVQPTGEPGAADSMTVDYVAVADGIHELVTGVTLEVGAFDTTTTIARTGGSFDTLTFTHGFGAAPVLLTEIQSSNNETINPANVSVPFLEVGVNSVATGSAEVALERAEATPGTVAQAETIAYLAIDAGVSGTANIGGTDILFETQKVTGIAGYDNGCYSRSLINSYGASPLVIGSQTLRAGNNGGWVRRCSLTSSNVGLTIDEDRTTDSERAHITENVDLLVFEGPFSGNLLNLNLVISGPGTGSTCSGNTVTLRVEDDDGNLLTNYTGLVNLTTSTTRGTWTTSGSGTLNDPTSGDGSASYTFAAGDGGQVDLLLSSPTSEDLTVTAEDPVESINATTGTITLRDNLFEISENDAFDDDVIAGRSHQFQVELVRRDGATCSVDTTYSGTYSLKAWISRDAADPGGIAPSLVAATTLASMPSTEPGSTNIDVTFTSGVAGIELESSDVGRYTLMMLDDSQSHAGIDLVSTTFSSPHVVRPFAIRVVATGNPSATTSTGSTYVSAGSDFTVTASGVLYEASDDDGVPTGTAGDGIADQHDDLVNNGVTPAFGQVETVQLGHALLAPVAGAAGSLTGASTLLSTFTTGNASAVFQYTEVGIIALSAVISDGSYLGASTAVTTRLAVGSGPVGRFYPDHFRVSVDTMGSYQASCTTATPFGYTGETFNFGLAPVFTIVPSHANGTAVTSNYEGAFRHLTATEITLAYPSADSGNALPMNTVPGTPTLTENGDGTMALTLDLLDAFTYQRGAGAEIAPYTVSAAIAVDD